MPRDDPDYEADPGYEAYEAIFDGVRAPFAFVDLEAVRRNAETMAAQAGAKPIRIASKSVRSRPLLERLSSHRPAVPGAAGFAGLLTYSLRETLFLAEHGWPDLVLAYPSTDAEALGRLAELGEVEPAGRPVVMVDSVAHLDLIEKAAGGRARPVRVCIDLDAGLWLFGGRVKVGVKRSPVHSQADAVALAREIESRPGLELVGLMAYEAQVAGVGDRPPGQALRGRAIRWMQKRSAREIAERRAEVVAAVREIANLEFVNGGGTGSISLTAAEDAVTEVAAGSGFYAPVQFDYYSRIELSPGAGFTLPIVRKPSAGIATAAGGGYLASGPGQASRLPRPWLPEGLRLDGEEGAGEVQTPLLGEAAGRLKVGDRVYFRHVKAGELCEHFNSLLLIDDGRIIDEVPTYRGEGHCFV